MGPGRPALPARPPSPIARLTPAPRPHRAGRGRKRDLYLRFFSTPGSPPLGCLAACIFTRQPPPARPGHGGGDG